MNRASKAVPEHVVDEDTPMGSYEARLLLRDLRNKELDSTMDVMAHVLQHKLDRASGKMVIWSAFSNKAILEDHRSFTVFIDTSGEHRSVHH